RRGRGSTSALPDGGADLLVRLLEQLGGGLVAQLLVRQAGHLGFQVHRTLLAAAGRRTELGQREAAVGLLERRLRDATGEHTSALAAHVERCREWVRGRDAADESEGHFASRANAYGRAPTAEATW